MFKRQIMKRALLLFAAVIILFSAGGCGMLISEYSYNVGKQCYLKHDYKEAFKNFKRAADRGNYLAQFAVGEMYKNGEGVERDLPGMIKYYDMALANKDTPKDLQLDIKGKLGMHYLGEQSILNVEKGLAYLTEAAECDELIHCQIALATCYYHGVGVKTDYAKAYQWASKAANADIPESADDKAGKIKCRGDARFLLGLMYFEGKGTAKDVDKACKCFKKGAEDGNADAQCMLAAMYIEGQGVAKDRNKGMQMLKDLAAKGNPKAKAILAEIK